MSLIKIKQLESLVQQQIIGQNKLINRLLIALLADGHLLVEGAPGLAKTRPVQGVGDCIESSFHRVQFTLDLLPTALNGPVSLRPTEGHL